MSQEFDAIIIGTGQAAPALAGRFDKEGLKVAVIERHQVGGSCVNFGCIPTKALVASARTAHLARRAADFGIVVEGEVRADMKRVKERMREISGESSRDSKTCRTSPCYGVMRASRGRGRYGWATSCSRPRRSS